MRAVVMVLLTAAAWAADVPRYFNVPHVATPHGVVVAMLALAEVGPSDVVYDLGSGDGRIVIAAVKDFGAKRAVGLDNKQELVDEARERAKTAIVAEHVEFRVADIFEADFSDATVVTIYLAEQANKVLRPRFEKLLKPGTRVVSHLFPIPGWEPEKVEMLGDRRVLLYRVPDQ